MPQAAQDGSLKDTYESEATLTGQIYHRLRHDLLYGHFQPGTKLRVQSLATQYGVGPSPVREALCSLSAEGLVDRFDQRGFRAAPASIEQFDELVEARCLLEDAVLRASIAAGTVAWEEGLVLANYRVQRFVCTSEVWDGPAWETCHDAFHDALLRACQIPTLLSYCRVLRERSIRYRNIGAMIPDPRRDVSGEHDAIAAAALNREADEAARLLTLHYRETARHLRLSLGNWAKN